METVRIHMGRVSLILNSAYNMFVLYFAIQHSISKLIDVHLSRL